LNQAPEPCYFKNQRTRRSYAEATRAARKLHAPLFSIIGLEIFTLDQFEQVWTSLNKFEQVEVMLRIQEQLENYLHLSFPSLG
jgi:hypothetical protein